MSFVTGGDRQIRSRRRPISELNTAQGDRFVPVGDPALWMDDALADVDRFDNLQSGWDGGNSVSPGPEVLELARRIIIAAAHKPNAPAPHIAPVSGGGVQLEWHVGTRDLELELLPNGLLAYLRSQGEAEDSGDLTIGRVEKAAELVEWLTQ